MDLIAVTNLCERPTQLTTEPPKTASKMGKAVQALPALVEF